MRVIDFYSHVRYNVFMNNLVLIGMPSSGKSTAGVLLAKKIGFGFIDCDLIIQGEQNALLSEIIERELYLQRVPLYEQYADVTIRCDGQTIDETVAAIAEATGFAIG